MVYREAWIQPQDGDPWVHIVRSGDQYFRNGHESAPFDFTAEYKSAYRVDSLKIGTPDTDEAIAIYTELSR